MIPILFGADTTDFSNYGIGLLSECISCEVTEERNGIFECVLKYPITGKLYDEIAKERILKIKPNDISNDQLFRIYRITTPINGDVMIYAQHISYDLSNIAIMPWATSSMSPSLALNKVFSDTVSSHEFTAETDHSVARAFSVKEPQSVRACLGGTEGSFLDVWGGEYEWDNFNVILHSQRGADNGVVIEYAKNMTDMQQEDSNTEIYTDLLPFAIYEDENGIEQVITLEETTLPIITSEFVRTKTLIKDFSEFFDGAITKSALRARAQSYIDSNPLGISIPSLTISFEPLWKQDEYSALFERVSLCDVVSIRHSELGITTSSKVIKTVYDALAEKYISITLGAARSNFVKSISDIKEEVKETKKKITGFPALIQKVISSATDLITGQTGGYVVLHGDEDGTPYELLILDAPSIDDAVNVWRWNSDGLGFSKNGYNGPYETAITADGEIVANFITAGTFNANLIRAGVISAYDNSSYWDLESGSFKFGGISYDGDKFEIDLTPELKEELKGDKGDKGDTGATGAKGDKGDTPQPQLARRKFAVRSNTLGAPSNTSTLWKDEPASFTSSQNLWVRDDIMYDGVWTYGEPYIGSNIKLKADSIELEGYTTVNESFKIDNAGKMTAKDVKLSGSFELDSEYINERTRLNIGSHGFYAYVSDGYSGISSIRLKSSRGELDGTWLLNGGSILSTGNFSEFFPMPVPVSLGGTGGDSASSARTSLGAAAASDFTGGAGYQKLPNGVIIQWGAASFSNSNSASFNFPVKFSSTTSASLMAVCVGGYRPLTAWLTSSGQVGNIVLESAFSGDARWIAIGT